MNTFTDASSLESQKCGLQREIEKLDTYSQNCLQGLFNQEQNFNQVAPNLSEDDRKSFWEKTEKSAMVHTYAFLYTNSLKEDKMKEMRGLEKKIEQEKSFGSSLASQEEN